MCVVGNKSPGEIEALDDRVAALLDVEYVTRIDGRPRIPVQSGDFCERCKDIQNSQPATDALHARSFSGEICSELFEQRLLKCHEFGIGSSNPFLQFLQLSGHKALGID